MMEKIVATVFAEMLAMYGKKFADQWSGSDPETLREVWEDKLSRYAHRPMVIRWALDACESLEWPPTLPQFLNICAEKSCVLARNEEEERKRSRALAVDPATVKPERYPTKEERAEIIRKMRGVLGKNPEGLPF